MMKSRKIIPSVMICSFLLLLSCNTITEDMLYGKYVLNEDRRQDDTIYILPNHQVLEIIKHRGNFYQCSGSWTLKNNWIGFDNIHNCDSAVKYWIGNYYHARIKKTRTGEIRIIYSSGDFFERGIYYKKISE
jgi:hypothetical protein